VISDQGERNAQFDGHIMNVARWPTATFALTSPVPFGHVGGGEDRESQGAGRAHDARSHAHRDRHGQCRGRGRPCGRTAFQLSVVITASMRSLPRPRLPGYRPPEPRGPSAPWVAAPAGV
jgi:hypothetical protein